MSGGLASGRVSALPAMEEPTELLILSNVRRRVVHFNVTPASNAAWVGQQMVEAFPWDTAPRFLLRDRDGVYGLEFRRRVHGMGIEEVVIAASSPWQNPYVERLLRDHITYYHESKTHLGLENDCREPSVVESAERGPVQSEPMVGGLHHRYFRRAA